MIDAQCQIHNLHVFACECCGRNTRGQTECSDIAMCPECYDLAGWDNEINDMGGHPSPEQMLHFEDLLSEIVSGGGDAARVKASNAYLWGPQA